MVYFSGYFDFAAEAAALWYTAVPQHKCKPLYFLFIMMKLIGYFLLETWMLYFSRKYCQ